MEHTLALIGRAHQGDKEARDTLFKENTGLITVLPGDFLEGAWRWKIYFRLAVSVFLKAVDKFDPAFDVKFSTYAIQ